MNEKMLELWPGGPLFRQTSQAPVGTDSVLLSAFAAGKGSRGIDLGCGSGILMLLLLTASEKLEMTGLEIQEEAAALARENLARAALSGRSTVLHGDLRRAQELLKAGSFDLAVANPPYYASGRGASAPDPGRATAREESDCTLEELCAAAAWLLPTGGRFCLVHRPERLSELFCEMTRQGLEPKRLRLCCHRPGAAPNLALVEGRRGGNPGLCVEPPLYLTDAEGKETEEIRRIYRRKSE